MPLPPEHIKERLSMAYVRAVAARAGAALEGTKEDYGDDGHIKAIQRLQNNKYVSSGYLFHFQVKSSVDVSIEDDIVVYDLDAEAYNKLADWEGVSPCLLLLFCLPRDPCEWLCITEDELLLRRCCYWYRVTGRRTENSSSQRIFVPRSQVFTPAAVVDWLDRVRQGDY